MGHQEHHHMEDLSMTMDQLNQICETLEEDKEPAYEKMVQSNKSEEEAEIVVSGDGDDNDKNIEDEEEEEEERDVSKNESKGVSKRSKLRGYIESLDQYKDMKTNAEKLVECLKKTDNIINNYHTKLMSFNKANKLSKKHVSKIKHVSETQQSTSDYVEENLDNLLNDNGKRVHFLETESAVEEKRVEVFEQVREKLRMELENINISAHVEEFSKRMTLLTNVVLPQYNSHYEYVTEDDDEEDTEEGGEKDGYPQSVTVTSKLCGKYNSPDFPIAGGYPIIHYSSKTNEIRMLASLKLFQRCQVGKTFFMLLGHEIVRIARLEGAGVEGDERYSLIREIHNLVGDDVVKIPEPVVERSEVILTHQDMANSYSSGWLRDIFPLPEYSIDTCDHARVVNVYSFRNNVSIGLRKSPLLFNLPHYDINAHYFIKNGIFQQHPTLVKTRKMLKENISLKSLVASNSSNKRNSIDALYDRIKDDNEEKRRGKQMTKLKVLMFSKTDFYARYSKSSEDNRFITNGFADMTTCEEEKNLEFSRYPTVGNLVQLEKVLREEIELGESRTLNKLFRMLKEDETEDGKDEDKGDQDEISVDAAPTISSSPSSTLKQTSQDILRRIFNVTSMLDMMYDNFPVNSRIVNLVQDFFNKLFDAEMKRNTLTRPSDFVHNFNSIGQEISSNTKNGSYSFMSRYDGFILTGLRSYSGRLQGEGGNISKNHIIRAFNVFSPIPKFVQVTPLPVANLSKEMMVICQGQIDNSIPFSYVDLKENLGVIMLRRMGQHIQKITHKKKYHNDKISLIDIITPAEMSSNELKKSLQKLAIIERQRDEGVITLATTAARVVGCSECTRDCDVCCQLSRNQKMMDCNDIITKKDLDNLAKGFRAIITILKDQDMSNVVASTAVGNRIPISTYTQNNASFASICFNDSSIENHLKCNLRGWKEKYDHICASVLLYDELQKTVMGLSKLYKNILNKCERLSKKMDKSPRETGEPARKHVKK